MADKLYRKTETTAGAVQRLPAFDDLAPPPSHAPAAGQARVTVKTPAQRYVATVTVVFAAVLLSAWAWAYFGKMWFLDTEYTTWRAKMDMVQSCTPAETAIMGDSQPMAGLIPSLVGQSSINLAIGGASPISTYFQVRRLLNCPNPPRRLLVSFTPGTLTWAEFYWTRAVFFRFYNLEETEEVRIASKELDDPQLYPNKRYRDLRGYVKNVSYELAVPFHYAAAMLNALVFTRGWENAREYSATLEAAGHRFVGTAPAAPWPSPASYFDGFKPGRLQDYYFNRLLSLLAERNIDVFYTAMPESELTQAKMPPAVETQLSDYLADLSRRHANFHVLIKPFTFLPPSNFGDSEHLNDVGAKYWSAIVGKRLAEAVASTSRP